MLFLNMVCLTVAFAVSLHVSKGEFKDQGDGLGIEDGNLRCRYALPAVASAQFPILLNLIIIQNAVLSKIDYNMEFA
jgi:hypothetical protein